MLVLKKPDGRAEAVALGAGAAINLRRATQMDVGACYAQARQEVLAFAQPESGGLLAQILPGFSVDAMAEEATVNAAIEMFALMHLVMQCNDGWSGIGDETGAPIAVPVREYVLLLLNDPAAFAAIDNFFKRRLYDEVLEKKGSPVSQSGGAGIRATAESVGASANAAPPAFPSTAG
jgi:hypothetical protein